MDEGPRQQTSGAGDIESGEAFGTPEAYDDADEEWLIEGYVRLRLT
jgi:hypothetical protein